VTLGALIALVAAILIALSTSGGGSRPLNPFAASWGRPLGDTQTSSDSAQLVNGFVASYHANYGAVDINAGARGLPTITIPANQPSVPIDVREGCSDFRPNTGSQVPIPPGAAVSTSSDGPLVVWQPAHDTEWEFWQIHATGSGYTACWGGKLTNVSKSRGVFPANYGLSATGISYLGTEITEADVRAGAIRHVIAIAIPNCNGYVPPAVRGDCGSDPGYPAEGQWLRLPADTRVPAGLTPLAKMILVALTKYGMVVTDYAGAAVLQAQYSATPGDPIQTAFAGKSSTAALKGIPWSDLQVINPSTST
jgi:hypothetical protein